MCSTMYLDEDNFRTHGPTGTARNVIVIFENPRDLHQFRSAQTFVVMDPLGPLGPVPTFVVICQRS